MTLKDQLEAKRRRRLQVPVQVSDPAEDQQILMAAATAYATEIDDDAKAVLSRQVSEAEQNLAKHWAAVELQSLPSAEWEAAVAAWQTVEIQDDTPTVVTDWAAALPPLLALSCVDEDLRDAEWWTQVLASEAWTAGDKDVLKMAILRLNVEAMEGGYPKG